MRERSRGYEIKDVDAEELADINRGRGKAEVDLKSKKIEAKVGITKDTKLEDLEALAVPEGEHRVVVADISDIVDRYAKTLADAKVKEHLETKSRWYNRWFVRQTEAGYFEKYYRDAKEEMLKNRNLMADIETRWFGKAQGKKQEKSTEQAHFEVLDEVIESMWQERLRSEESKEVVEGESHVKEAEMDAAATELIAAYVLGEVGSREEFEKQAEEKIVKPHMQRKDKKAGEMYGSNLFAIADTYKKQIEEKLEIVEGRFGPEQKGLVKTYLRKVIKLDVMFAKKNADIIRTQSTGVLKWLEKTINFTQNPILKESGSCFGKIAKGLNKGRKATSVLTIGNPVLYAFLGNRIAYGGAVATGVFAAKATAIGAAAALGIGPGMVMAGGAAVGAGIYLGARAAVERFRDIRRRQEEAVLGKRGNETFTLMHGRQAVDDLLKLAIKTEKLSEKEKLDAAKIMATLRLQDSLGKNLISISKEEGERYKTNFLAVQDLRRAINDFWTAKAGQFGETAISQRQALDNLIAAAERDIANQVQGKDKEIAKEIRMRGLKVGAMGAIATFTAACLAPGAYKAFKMGANRVMEATGIQPKFDTSKITFTEEIGHKIKELFGGRHYDVFSGDLATKMQLVSGQGDIVNLPPGFSIKNHGSFIELNVNGQTIQNLKIPIDAQGRVTDMGGFEDLRKLGWQIEHQTTALAGAPRGGGSTEWFNQVKAGNTEGVTVSEVHTKGFYNNATPESDLNELRFYMKSDGSGNIILDAGGLREHGSFRMIGPNKVEADISALAGSGRL